MAICRGTIRALSDCLIGGSTAAYLHTITPLYLPAEQQEEEVVRIEDGGLGRGELSDGAAEVEG